MSDQLPHYVYVHRLAGTATEFYVGKGVGKRAWAGGLGTRSQWWHEVVAKHGGFDVEILGRFATHEEALTYEADRIALFRLVENLVNAHDVGAGSVGHGAPAEYRAVLSAKATAWRKDPEFLARAGEASKAAWAARRAGAPGYAPIPSKRPPA